MQSTTTKDNTTYADLTHGSAENPYPKYFFHETNDNIFKAIPHKETPYVSRAFHLTQPEQRMQDFYFQNKVTNLDDSIMSSPVYASKRMNATWGNFSDNQSLDN